MNNKDNQNMITTKIQGTDFTYNKETHYEKDGHIYCKNCNERIDGKPIPMLNKPMIFRLYYRTYLQAMLRGKRDTTYKPRNDGKEDTKTKCLCRKCR